MSTRQWCRWPEMCVFFFFWFILTSWLQFFSIAKRQWARLELNVQNSHYSLHYQQSPEHNLSTTLNTRLKTGSVCTTLCTTLTEITHTVTQNTQRKNSSIKHKCRKYKLFIFAVSTISHFIQSNIFFKENSDNISFDIFTFLEHNNGKLAVCFNSL